MNSLSIEEIRNAVCLGTLDANRAAREGQLLSMTLHHLHEFSWEMVRLFDVINQTQETSLTFSDMVGIVHLAVTRVLLGDNSPHKLQLSEEDLLSISDHIHKRLFPLQRQAAMECIKSSQKYWKRPTPA